MEVTIPKILELLGEQTVKVRLLEDENRLLRAALPEHTNIVELFDGLKGQGDGGNDDSAGGTESATPQE